MRRAGKLGLAMALALAVAPALAVDVDRIEIRSRLGEPLLAEIPVTGATPQELEQLKAQLASATTFARIGLPRPSGVVADLQFEVVRGARPVIRVTSTLPVQEEFLTFLLQVDAPQGRLVREYSLALGAAPSLPDALPPAIQAPVVEGNAVARPQPVIDPANALPAPPEPAPAQQAAPPAALPAMPPIPLSGEGRAASAPAAASVPAPAAPAPVPLASQPPAPKPGPAPGSAAPEPAAAKPAASGVAAPAQAAAAQPPTRRAAAPRPAPPAAPAASARRPGDYTVRRGDNLSRVVDRMQIEGATAQQAMLALLRANPQAFGSGNINLLREGAVLRAPSTVELGRLDPVAAEAMVRLQIQQWRSGDMPPVVPEQLAAPAGDAPASASTVADSAAGAPRVAPARLEIAPASEAGAQAASGAGTTQGGEAGTRERAAADLVAARYTEFQQMQQRIAELEQAQKAQQHLLALKDRELAAQRPQSAGLWPWLVALLAVLVASGALWRGRRAQQPGRVARRLSTMVGGRGDARTQPPA